MTFQKLVPAFVLLTALSVEAFLPTFDMMSEDQMSSFLPSPHPELVAAYRDFESRTRYGKPRITQIVNVTTPVPPCCADTISSIACRRLYNHNPARFLQRCEFDPDFSLIQCCNTCGLESADQRYSKFFDKQQNSQHCYDRHSVDFCMRFLNKADVWGTSSWNCDGAFATLAFRICRRTCGFCKPDLYSTVGGKFQVTPCGRSPKLIASETIF
ncbi:unnamed protein product, partial [Mesorhabditis belari]|uniref:ShKT domain-containing protein n=1 Tax=Mesorhabditis belari TaxID=2138241 RepID=A0AAF3ES81_9BILA